MTSNKMSRGTSGTPRSLIKLEYLKNSILTATVGGFLYDKISLWGKTKNYEKTLSMIPFPKDGYCRSKKEPVKIGQLKNLRVQVSEAGNVNINGSLATYHIGHNISPMSYKQYCEVIKSLSKRFSINMMSYYVASCEFAVTIETIGNPVEYLKMCTDLRFKSGEALLPNTFDTTRYFKISQDKDFKLYDKSKQIGINRNLLRLEFRQKKKLERLRKSSTGFTGSVTLKEILEPAFVKHIASEFEKYFNSIGMSNRDSSYDQKEIRQAVNLALKRIKKGL